MMRLFAVLFTFLVLSPLGVLCAGCKEYVTLDLSEIDEKKFKKTDKRSEIEITLIDELATQGKCIGKVTSGEETLAEEPLVPCSRNVRILRISKNDPHYFDIEEAPARTGGTASGILSYTGRALSSAGGAICSTRKSLGGNVISTPLRMIGNMIGNSEPAPQAIEGPKTSEKPDETTTTSNNTVQAPESNEETPEDIQQPLLEGLDPEDFEEVLEIHTNYERVTARLRFKKENNKYTQLEYISKDVDVCENLDSVLVKKAYSAHTVYRPGIFELIGNVKCSDIVLSDSRNVFARTIEIDNSTKDIKINTIPIIGNVYFESFVLDKSGKMYMPKSSNGGCKYQILDFSDIYSYTKETEDLQTTCGPECIFYDGCSNLKHRIVALYNKNEPVLFSPNIQCISAKCEEINDSTYVTVYTKYKNSEKVTVKTYKSTDKDVFSETKREYVNLIIPENIGTNTVSTPESQTTAENEGDTSENAQSNDKLYDLYSNLGTSDPSKLLNIKLDSQGFIKVYSGKNGIVFHMSKDAIVEKAIGDVFFDDQQITEFKSDIYNREVIYDITNKSIIVLDEFKDGRFERAVYKEDNGQFTSCLPSPLAIDLKGDDLGEHLEVITTDNSRTFLTTMNHVNKIGTISEGARFITPNKHQNIHVSLLYNEKELFARTRLSNGRFVHQKFSEAHPFDDSFPPLHLENAKEFIILNLDDASCIYTHLYSLENLNMIGSSLNFSKISNAPERSAPFLEVVNVGDYYAIGVAPSNVFTHCIGYVTFAKDTIIPLDYNLYSRTVYIPTTSLSHFIVKNCDFTECWSDLYVAKIIDGKVKFEIQEKVAVDIDLDDKVSLDDRVSKTLTGSVRFFRIREDLSYKYKIGKVSLKGTVIAEDAPNIFSRMVNFAHAKEAQGSDSGTVRVLTVERWDKYGHAYSVKTENGEIQFSQNEPKKVKLDIQYGAVSRPDYVTLQHRDDVLNFFVNWQNSNDYVLGAVRASFYNKNQMSNPNESTLLPVDLKDPLPGNMPVHVRVHPDQKLVVVVENIPKDLPKPSNVDTYPLDYKTDKYEGEIFTYNVTNKKVKTPSEYLRDDSFRTLYTPFFYDLKKKRSR